MSASKKNATKLKHFKHSFFKNKKKKHFNFTKKVKFKMVLERKSKRVSTQEWERKEERERDVLAQVISNKVEDIYSMKVYGCMIC